MPLRRASYTKFHVGSAFFIGCCVGSLLLTAVHVSHLDQLGDIRSVSSVHHSLKAKHQQQDAILHALEISKKAKHGNTNKQKNIAANHDNEVHPVAGLQCEEHGGPALPKDAQEMVYWRDIPEDNGWTSPFRDITERRYLTFVPDGGGWNNIRMSMETVLTMALAMGRVLVLPPSQKMYLLGKTNFNFADFFPLQEMAEEHPGLEIITTQQFLEETMGKLVDVKTGRVTYPPHNRTTWDGDTNGVKHALDPWMEAISVNPDWDPRDCIAAFPKSSDPKDLQVLTKAMAYILGEAGGDKDLEHIVLEYVNRPTPLDASTKDRLREFLAGRDRLCLYDESLQKAPIIHFHGKAKQETGGRLLVHFYAFLFFQDWKTQLWMNRFVRDHVRYIDDIQCAAARIVHAIRMTKVQPSDQGQFDAFHVRRGDFQYKKTRVSAEELVAAAEKEIPKGRTVYIGTDERHKEFFDPLKEHGWNILFLDDFQDLLGDINPNYYGMIDQLITSRAHTFFGCWFSTFTGYITRLRGYHSQADLIGMSEDDPNAKAFKDGKLPHSYYYALAEHKNKLHDYWPIKKAFYAREFPSSWLNLEYEMSE